MDGDGNRRGINLALFQACTIFAIPGNEARVLESTLSDFHTWKLIAMLYIR